MKAAGVDEGMYDLFFAAGGYGVLIGFSGGRGLQKLASLRFPGVTNPKTGKSIMLGKVVTGFPTKGEKRKKFLRTTISWRRSTTEQTAADANATFVHHPEDMFDSFAQTDGRVVTGANPHSALVTAEEAVKAFDKLQA